MRTRLHFCILSTFDSQHSNFTVLSQVQSNDRSGQNFQARVCFWPLKDFSLRHRALGRCRVFSPSATNTPLRWTAGPSCHCTLAPACVCAPAKCHRYCQSMTQLKWFTWCQNLERFPLCSFQHWEHTVWQRESCCVRWTMVTTVSHHWNFVSCGIVIPILSRPASIHGTRNSLSVLKLPIIDSPPEREFQSPSRLSRCWVLSSPDWCHLFVQLQQTNSAKTGFFFIPTWRVSENNERPGVSGKANSWRERKTFQGFWRSGVHLVSRVLLVFIYISGQ